MEAAGNLAAVLVVDEVLGVHVDRAGPVFRCSDFRCQQVLPAIRFDLVNRAVELLDFDRLVSLVDSDYFEQRPIGSLEPLTDEGVLCCFFCLYISL